MGKEATLRYYENSQSELCRRTSSEYSSTGLLELSSKRGAPWRQRYGPSRRWDDSPSRSDGPSRRWERSLRRKDDTWSEVTMRSNCPRIGDAYLTPLGLALLECHILIQDFHENRTLGNDVTLYDYYSSDTELYSHFIKYCYFWERRPYVILSQSTLERITSVTDYHSSVEMVTRVSTTRCELRNLLRYLLVWHR
jgi:hypothetical protein